MTTDTHPLAPTDAEIWHLWVPMARKGVADPVDFARAVLAKWGTLRSDSIVIPTETMEQEFQKHYRRGYEAGKKAATPQPTQAQAEPKSGAKSFQTYGEANAYSKGYYAGKKAATQAQAQAGAVPLTDEQIEALPMWKRFVGLWPETRREIVRIIESAHGIGIKGGQHGTD